MQTSGRTEKGERHRLYNENIVENFIYLATAPQPSIRRLANQLLTQILVAHDATVAELVVAMDRRVFRKIATPRVLPDFDIEWDDPVPAQLSLALFVTSAITQGCGPVPAPLVCHWVMAIALASAVQEKPWGGV